MGLGQQGSCLDKVALRLESDGRRQPADAPPDHEDLQPRVSIVWIRIRSPVHHERWLW